MVRGSWCMDKRILIFGSICAVAILIGVSFTSVVGYSNDNSNYERISPLFNTRTKRAIKDDNRDISTYDYIGKGKTSVLHIPTLDERIELMIDKIKNMDSKSFNRLKLNLIKQLRYSDIIKNEDSSEITLLLNQMRDKTLVFTEKTDCTTKPFMIICGIVQGFLAVFTIYLIIFIIDIFYY